MQLAHRLVNVAWNFCVLQPPVGYSKLKEIGRWRIDSSGDLQGLSLVDCKLLVVWGRGGSYNKCMLRAYSRSYDEGIGTYFRHLDSMTLHAEYARSPRVDRHSHRIFVPCEIGGVVVARMDEDKFVEEKTLTSVKEAHNVDAVSPDIIYVCDWDTYSVKVVDVTRDVITATLEKPEEAEGKRPVRLAVLGDSIMVTYDGLILTVYRHGIVAPVKVIRPPEGLKLVSAMSTDGMGHFLLTDFKTKSVFAFDFNGHLRCRVHVNNDSKTCDCVVVVRELWVGCTNGDIVFMSSDETLPQRPSTPSPEESEQEMLNLASQESKTVLHDPRAEMID